MTGTVDEIYRKNSSRPPFKGYGRTRNPMSFSAALERAKMSGKLGIIAEYKRFSPSGFKNSMNQDLRGYHRKMVEAGVDALSILTEPDFFGGRYEDMIQSQGMGVPLLAKDFFSSREMINSAYRCGADAVLLIADFLLPDTLTDLCSYSHRLGMEVITEFHDLRVGIGALSSGTDMLGYNRRNLRTLTMEGEERDAIRIMKKFEGIKILESGINMENIDKVIMPGYDSVLIGEALLGNQDLINRLHEIRVS
jgi:indole-3-glycerol phosphate synthase